MEQYRVYLKGELGKLGSADRARDFLAGSECQPGAIGLQLDEAWVADRFSTQDRVDDYVESLDDAALAGLTARCGRWRNNDIVAKLRGHRVDFVKVPVGDVFLSQAEDWLGADFRRLAYRLTAIAADPVVLAAPAYRDRADHERIDYPWCLARPHPVVPGAFKVFDGMHRAIQMVRNGEATIPLCVIYER